MSKNHECPPYGYHDNGWCAGFCPECGGHLILDGRYFPVPCCESVNEEDENGTPTQ